MGNWYPKASTAQNYSTKYPGSLLKPNVVVLHSTEGTGWPTYNGGASAPTFTVKPDFNKKIIDVRQHFPANRSSRALVNLAGGVETNTLNAIQIELIGTCDPSAHKKWGSVRHIYMPEPPDWYIEALAELIKWIDDTYPDFKLQDAAPRGWLAYPTSYGSSKARMSGKEWLGAYGIVGHQHVPENAHGDPGAFPIAKLIKAAGGTSSAKPTTPEPVVKTKKFGRHISINIWGNDGDKGTATALTRIPTIVKDVVNSKPVIVDCQEVRSGAQLDLLTKEFKKYGFARSAYLKECKLATFIKTGTVKPVGPVVRTQYMNQNKGQKEGLLARGYTVNGLTIAAGQTHLDYRDGYDQGRVNQAKEAFKVLDALAKTLKADASVLSGDMNSKSWVTDRAAKPAGYHEAWTDKGKDPDKKIDHTYLKGAVATYAFERKTKSDHHMQITDISVVI